MRARSSSAICLPDQLPAPSAGTAPAAAAGVMSAQASASSSAPSAPAPGVSAPPASAQNATHGHSPPSATPLADLAVACVGDGTRGGTPVIVCLPVKERWNEKFMTGMPSLLLSLVALCVSLYTLVYNRRKDDRQRLRSVDDEYWLRKVLSPHSIEPFLKFSTELIQHLPPAEGSEPASEAAAFVQLRIQLRGLMTAFDALAVVDPQLAASVNALVEQFEDRLATYGYARKMFQESGAEEPSRSAALEDMAGIRTQVLHCIRKHQVSA